MNNRAYTPSDAPATMMKRPSKPIIAVPGRTCRLRLQFGIYFDGTNNNIFQDVEDRSHSNVARLYRSAVKDALNGIHAIYVQGVGTPFKEIGELVPHERGSSMGAMGYARIRYAQIAMANRVAFALTGKHLVGEDARSLADACGDDSLLPRLGRRLTYLVTSTSSPSLSEVVLDVFGFSRGATAARSFINQLQKNFCHVPRIFCGVPLRIRFVGLFDTVASVGLADSVPIPVDGHMSWGDQELLTIPDTVEQCVHLVAAHEGRNSFPLDLVLQRNGSYPDSCLEIVYPGMHSDVGGGYGPVSQGKGTVLNQGYMQGDAHMLSQIALNDMYERALSAGVCLRTREAIHKDSLARDFEVHPSLRASFDGYLKSTGLVGSGLPVMRQYLAHRRLYLGWRKYVLGKAEFERQCFVLRSNAQDKVNLTDSNDQLRQYVTNLPIQERALAEYQRDAEMGYARRPAPVVDSEGIALYRKDWVPAPTPPVAVRDFLSQYVHDSRAGFLLTDPVSAYDHKVIHDRLEVKDRRHSEQLADYERRVKDYQAGRTAGHASMAGLVRPADPLSPIERKNLAIYRKGERPVYDDANPASKSDGDFGLKHVVLAAMDSRREIHWSYLHPRQMFAYQRISYET